MNRLLGRVQLRTKLLILLLAPLAGLTYFATATVLDRQADATRASGLLQLVDLSVRTGNLVHEMQRERGATSVFMSAKGARFGPEVEAQRAKTDARAKEFTSFVQANEAALPTDVVKRLGPAVVAVTDLADRRRQATALAVPAAEIIRYYTTSNAALIDTLGALASANTNAELAQMANAYFTFHLAKERVGIERAQLANVFGTGAFAKGQFFTVAGAIAAQESFLKLFGESAKPAIRAAYAARMADPVVADVKAMEDIAITKNTTGGFGVDSAVWYDKITAKINLLKQVEDLQASALLSRATQLRSDAGTARDAAAVLALVLIGLATGLAVLVIHSVTRPLAATIGALERVAAGDLTVSVAVTSTDEVGRLGAALNQAVHGVRDTLLSISGGTDRLAGSTATLSTVGEEMRVTAGAVADQATSVSAAAERVSTNVQTVAAAAEEMGDSIKEIAVSSAEAARITGEAVDAARAATVTVTQLGDSSAKIGTVLSLISAIAAQTNLLALNATIEAARAGEAGKGFAVVASEVKDLALETAKATQDIGAHIESIQSDTTNAVEAINEITTVINSVNGHVTTIAAAVGEQHTTTEEIGTGVTQAANGATQIASNIAGLAATTGGTTVAANQTGRCSEELAGFAAELHQLVGRFQLN